MKLPTVIYTTALKMKDRIPLTYCNEQFGSCYWLLGQEERWSYVYRPVRCLFEFVLLQMCRILDVHLLLNWCARGQGRLNRTERTIFHWSINRDLDRVIHITRHMYQMNSFNSMLTIEFDAIHLLVNACHLIEVTRTRKHSWKAWVEADVHVNTVIKSTRQHKIDQY
jgi:hypothetical protein